MLIEEGTSVTVKAVADTNKQFLHWTVDNEIVAGAGAEYSFTVTKDITLVAHFNTNGISENETVQFSIFPNPVTHNLLKVVRSTHNKARMEIYNSVGSLVMIQQFEVNETHANINLSSLSSGIYIIRLVEGQRTNTQHFIKE